MSRASVAVVGPGNVGTDLLVKLLRSEHLDLRYVVGVDPASDGFSLARESGVATSAEGVDWLLSRADLPELVFDATSAAAHLVNAPRYAEAGVRVVDLTPAAAGPFVCPAVNLDRHASAPNLSLISCGGQAAVPMVRAVSRVAPVIYAEVVTCVASRSVGPGARANIDEFTATTARALESVGGAGRGKAIVILNPVEPPVVMRDTVFCAIPADSDQGEITSSILRAVAEVRRYAPGYALRAEPQFDGPRPEWRGLARVAVFLVVRGRGDYLPPYAGNLDIMTGAAVRVAESLVRERVGAL
ncbi:MAG TPA: acetaldehyde dehydrogenase (acetylating) [Mycobacteriales bacterium]|nr:acetaldehyde dehydrogenase (acetylating) [Mycobacteriales bacterium]